MLEPAGQGSGPEVSKVTLPVEVYRNISKSQAKFLDMVSYFLPEMCLFMCKLTAGTSCQCSDICVGKKEDFRLEQFLPLRRSTRHTVNCRCPVFISGDPEIGGPREDFLGGRGVRRPERVFPAARLQGAAAVGSVCPAEPGHRL